jgi:hypothetical protein
MVRNGYGTKRIFTMVRNGTRDHQTSYENFVCRINEEFINMFNNNETEVHIPLHRALRADLSCIFSLREK